MKAIKKYSGITHAFLRYLRCIYLLSREKKIIRVKDVADKIGVSTSAVTQAVQELAKRGYITHEHYGYIELTPKGEKIAKELYMMSQFFIEFFVKFLRIPEKIAEEDVCKMLYHFHLESLRKLIKLIEVINKRKFVPTIAP